jgi:hypothetical protein
MDHRDWTGEGVFLASNPNRRSNHGWPRTAPSRQRRWACAYGATMGCILRRSSGRGTMKGSRRGVAKNRAAVAGILTKGLAKIGVASKKARNNGASAPKPVTALAMLQWFFGLGEGWAAPGDFSDTSWPNGGARVALFGLDNGGWSKGSLRRVSMLKKRSPGLGFYRGWSRREVQGVLNQNPTRFDSLNWNFVLGSKRGKSWFNYDSNVNPGWVW